MNYLHSNTYLSASGQCDLRHSATPLLSGILPNRQACTRETDKGAHSSTSESGHPGRPRQGNGYIPSSSHGGISHCSERERTTTTQHASLTHTMRSERSWLPARLEETIPVLPKPPDFLLQPALGLSQISHSSSRCSPSTCSGHEAVSKTGLALDLRS